MEDLLVRDRIAPPPVPSGPRPAPDYRRPRPACHAVFLADGAAPGIGPPPGGDYTSKSRVLSRRYGSMANAPFGTVLRHIRRLAAPDPAAEATDGHLLERFAARG